MIYGIIVFGLWKGSGVHRKGLPIFPGMFGYEDTLFGPKGKAGKVFRKSKRNFCRVQVPDARIPSVWSRGPRRTLAFWVKLTLWRLLLQVSTPRLNI